MAEVMTIFQANVATAQRSALKAKWKEITEQRPEQMVAGWLVQALDAPEIWCEVSLWKSREALEDYDASVSRLPANEMFRSLDAVPVLAAFEVAEEG